MADELRCHYEMLKYVKDTAKERHGDVSEAVRMIRKKIAQIQSVKEDPLRYSVREEWHRLYDKDGEGGYDFTILPDNGETEEGLYKQVMFEVGFAPIASPYDCTGKRFTAWVEIKRVPAGVAVVHRWGLDV